MADVLLSDVPAISLPVVDGDKAYIVRKISDDHYEEGLAPVEALREFFAADTDILVPLALTTTSYKMSSMKDGLLSFIENKLDATSTITVVGDTRFGIDPYSLGLTRGGTSWAVGGVYVTLRETHPTASNSPLDTTLLVNLIADPVSIVPIETKLDGRPLVIPQSFYDKVTKEALDTNMHPHLGTATLTAVADGPMMTASTWDLGRVPETGDILNVSGHRVVMDINSTEIPEFAPGLEASNPYVNASTGLLNPANFGLLPAGAIILKGIHVSGNGVLEWALTPTRLYVETVFAHGALVIGDVSRFIPEHATPGKVQAEIVHCFWDLPGTTAKGGIVAMDAFRVHGAPKAARKDLSSDALSGANSITVAGLSAADNWRVGDDIIIASTTDAGSWVIDPQYTGPTQFWGPRATLQKNQGSVFESMYTKKSNDEVRTITSINLGTGVITWAGGNPLTSNHKAYTDTALDGTVLTVRPFVVNNSRSILVRSLFPGKRQTRGHIMAMHGQDVDVRYFRGSQLGRTDVDPSMVVPAAPDGEWPVNGRPVLASNGGSSITDSNNVRGRYPLHFHSNGPYNGRKAIACKGVVMDTPVGAIPQPGWALVAHDARVLFEECTVYNVRGAAFDWENGNELGQAVRCNALWARGDGFFVDFFERHEVWENHNGHMGVGFEMQARQIYMEDNRATSCNFGYLYYQQAVNAMKRIPDQHSLRYLDPLTQGGGSGLTSSDYFTSYGLDNDTYGIEAAQIPHFNDNYSYGCLNAFGVGHRQHTDRQDTTPAVFHRMHAVNCSTAVYLQNYSYDYGYYHCLWTRDTQGGTAVKLGNVSWQWVFCNNVLRNWANGFQDNGSRTNWNGEWVDNRFYNVATEFVQSTVEINVEDLTTKAGYYAYEPWVVVNESVPNPGKTVNVRTWSNKLSASLPLSTPGFPGPAGVRPSGTEAYPTPYFWLDPTSDTSMTNSYSSLNLKGVIVDRIGVKWAWDHRSSEDMNNFPTVRQTRTAYYTTATACVLRNGCFNDGGTWKSRLWFVEVERYSGDYFSYYVDVTLSGVDSDVLAANTILPNARDPMQWLPLKAESVEPARPYMHQTETPAMVGPFDYAIAENLKLKIELHSNTEHPSYVLGGTDAGDLELVAATSSALAYVRFVGDGSPDYETPTDDGSNNVYNFTITVTNSKGTAAAPQAYTVTVQNKTETVVSPYTNNFSVARNIDDDPDVVLLRGVVGSGVASGGLLRAISGADGLYAFPPTGSAVNYVKFKSKQSFNFSAALFGMVDADNYFAISVYNGQIYLSRRLAGVNVGLTNFAHTHGNDKVIEARISGTTITTYVDTVLVNTYNVTGGVPGGSYCGVLVKQQTPGQTVEVFDDMGSGAV